MKIDKRSRRRAKELFRLCMAGDTLDEPRARQLAGEVVAGGGRKSLAVVAHFLRLVELEQAGQTARVESAVPLPEDLRALIESGLTRRYGRALATAYAHRPELIGGVRIRAANDIFDGTVLTALETLEKSF